MRSLRGRLFVLVTLATTLVWTLAATWTIVSTREEVQDVLDSRLLEAARMVAALNLGPRRDASGVQDLSSYSRQLSCQIWTLDGALVGRSAGAPTRPLAVVESGFSERVIEEERWRIYTHIDTERGLRVMVGDKLRVRRMLLRDMLAGLLLPAIAGLIFLGVMIWFSIARGLRPVRWLAAAIEERSADDAAEIAVGKVPAEIEPLVNAMNRLFSRLEAARRSERDFVANAAHELQTPLAGLKAQAEVAARTSDPDMRRSALVRISRAVDRTGRLVRQLLVLARLQDKKSYTPVGEVSLDSLLGEILDDWHPLAQQRDAVLNMKQPCSYCLCVDPDLLRLAIGNLVENAIIYGGYGQTVSIRCRAGSRFEIHIEDSGPGIAPDKRKTLRRRFERGSSASETGTGLGFSIVETALEALDGHLELMHSQAGGLLAVISLPKSIIRS
ncbi:ATP-binding protein [Henriciella sp.]|uniref:ATP-binding protein n=1 Tax=Henriciella sp. TaxID=1968823 RepID=UPI0026237B01|nr:ATP-binding protein [Henriciella sp.]